VLATRLPGTVACRAVALSEGGRDSRRDIFQVTSTGFLDYARNDILL